MCTENEHCMKDFEGRTLVKSKNGGDKINNSHSADQYFPSNRSNQACMPKPIRSEKMDMSFDHLSVVSEECLSNSDDQTNNQAISKSDDVFLSNTETESPYANFQSTIPPLKHFENLSYKDIGPNIGKTLSELFK